MKYALVFGIFLLSLCSCERTKTLNQFRKELKANFPDESIGVIYKRDRGYTSILVNNSEDLIKDLKPNTLLVEFKKSEQSDYEESELLELTETIKGIIQSIYGDQVQYCQLRFNTRKDFRKTDKIDFVIN